MSNEGAIMSVGSTFATESEGRPALEEVEPPDVDHEKPDFVRQRGVTQRHHRPTRGSPKYPEL